MPTDRPATDPQAPVTPEPAEKKRKRRPWLTALKWVVGVVAGLILLLLLGVGVAVWILTPERLPPLVEKYASEYIDGELKASRIELTYWKTFPRLLLDVDSLRVTSHSLRGLPAAERAKLPADADSLLSVNSLHGGINILELLRGRIALYDIVIDRPKVNLVDVDSLTSNYNIFPVSEEADTTSAVIPDLKFTRFAIKGDAPIRYMSLADSIELTLNLSEISLDGDGAPAYAFRLGADADSRFGDLTLSNLRLGMGGDILWSSANPYLIELKDFEAGINNIVTRTSTVVDFEKDLTVRSLDFAMPEVKVDSLIHVIPPAMRGELDKITNSLSVSLTARLLKPYVVSGEKYPSMQLSLRVPEGSLSYEQLRLRRLALEADATIDGDNPDASRIVLKRLVAIGEGVGFEINGTLDYPMSDPFIDGTFKGGIEFSRLPASLVKQIGCKVSGSLRADAQLRTRASWLTRDNFHRIKASGDASLTDFRLSMPEMDVDCFINDARIKLGTSSKFVRGDVSSDSLLTASLKIDTLAASLPGMEATASRLLVGAGCKNTANSADTTQINPIGAVFSVGRFNFLDTNDSTRIRLREAKAHASVKRFRESKRKPLMNLGVNAKRMRYASGMTRAGISQAEIRLTLHPSLPKIGKRTRARMDSLSRVYPQLQRDSIYRMAMRMRTPRRHRPDSLAPSEGTNMDYGLDHETKSLLRQWSASGDFKAKRAMVYTPYFPLRNRLTDIDLHFNNDSITVNNTRYRVGHSDFLIDGTISNITRALTSRTGRQQLNVNFRVTSDTIDINQIAAALFAGAAFAEKERQGLVAAIADSDDDDVVQQSIAAQADSTDSGPLLVPTNIAATLRLNARNVIYSDFLFQNFRGLVEVYDGTINMRNLSARSAVGAVDLTALYEGVSAQNLNFAFGLNVRDFRVGRFLDLVPSLDTIMPLLENMDGIINGQVAAQARLDSLMDVRIPTLNAAVTLQGDSLVLLDAETFRSIGKWLLFKNKKRNVIDSMQVKLVVKNSVMQLYPFMFDIDRYRLGVYGNNDLDLNFKYHVAVLKSPIPFKFGINVSGTPDKMKIRLGGAKWDEKSATRTFVIADTTRVNLVNQIQGLFRRAVRNSREPLEIHLDNTPARSGFDAEAGADTISHADSLLFIREGLIPAPPAPAPESADTKKKKK